MNPELRPIADVCGGAVRFMTEGGQEYVHMERLHFMVGGQAKEMDALLCLNYPNSSYPTKLMLAENVGHGLNWNESPYVLGRQWFSWSWQGVRQGMSPFETLAAHLEAFR